MLILRVVFSVRVCGQIYGLINEVVFTGQVYDQLYWIELQPKFTCQVFGPNIRVNCRGRVYETCL